MFNRMIENKRNQWLSSSDCTITSLIDYIVKTGQMRDAQIEAIKTLSAMTDWSLLNLLA